MSYDGKSGQTLRFSDQRRHDGSTRHVQVHGFKCDRERFEQIESNEPWTFERLNHGYLRPYTQHESMPRTHTYSSGSIKLWTSPWHHNMIMLIKCKSNTEALMCIFSIKIFLAVMSGRFLKMDTWGKYTLIPWASGSERHGAMICNNERWCADRISVRGFPLVFFLNCIVARVPQIPDGYVEESVL